jgi:hypothetical protein
MTPKPTCGSGRALHCTECIGTAPLAFDENSVLVEIAQRNAVRAESNLPLLDAMKEIARLKQVGEIP